MNVLLLGNYPNDGQESMRRFGDLLAVQLADHGIQTECVAPSSIFGRLCASGHGVGKFLGYLDKFLLFPSKLRNRVRQFDSESVVHICDHSNAIYTRFLARIPHVVTCHDLLAVRCALGEFPSHRTRASGRVYQRLILGGLNNAQQVACVSRATGRDVRRISRLEERQVTVVHNGLNHPYAPLPDPDISKCLSRSAGKFGNGAGAKLEEGFILHVGGNQWYKNRLGVIQIYARLCEKTSLTPYLVMVGKSFTPEMRRLVSGNHLEDRVIELNTVSNEDLRTLYCAAQLLLFPSFVEGFGWPIIEAQACGCRVVIADREPMTEIAGDAAVCFDLEAPGKCENAPMSSRAVDIAVNAVMETLLETHEERLNRVRNGLRNAARFSTERMVESYIDLYRRILSFGEEQHMCSKNVGNEVA